MDDHKAYGVSHRNTGTVIYEKVSPFQYQYSMIRLVSFGKQLVNIGSFIYTPQIGGRFIELWKRRQWPYLQLEETYLVSSWGDHMFQECKLRGDRREDITEEIGATLGEDRWEARTSMGIFVWLESFASIKGSCPHFMTYGSPNVEIVYGPKQIFYFTGISIVSKLKCLN